MDGFAIVMFGGVAVVVGLLWLVGRSNPTGSAGLGLDARAIEERRTALEIEDEQQVRDALEVLRARRTAREAGSDPAGRRVDEAGHGSGGAGEA